MLTIDNEFLRKSKNFFTSKKSVVIIGSDVFPFPDSLSTALKELKSFEKSVFPNNLEIKQEGKKEYLKLFFLFQKQCKILLPNKFHDFLNSVHARIYATSITGIEEKSGINFSCTEETKGIYLLGNPNKVICSYCGHSKKIDEELEQYENEKEAFCPKCMERGKNRKRMGEMYPETIPTFNTRSNELFAVKMLKKENCDLLMVFGEDFGEAKKTVKNFIKNFKGKKLLVNWKIPNEFKESFDYFYSGDGLEFVNGQVEFEIEAKKKEEIEDIGTFYSNVENKIELEKKCKMEDIGTFYSNDKMEDIGTFYSNDKMEDIGTFYSNAEVKFESNKKDLGTLNKTEIPVVPFNKTEIPLETTVKKLSISNSPNSFEKKLRLLSKSLSEETLCMNVLDEVLLNSVQTEIEDSYSFLEGEISELNKKD